MADALSDLRYISRMGYRDPWAEATKSISDSLLAYGKSKLQRDTLIQNLQDKEEERDYRRTRDAQTDAMKLFQGATPEVQLALLNSSKFQGSLPEDYVEIAKPIAEQQATYQTEMKDLYSTVVGTGTVDEKLTAYNSAKSRFRKEDKYYPNAFNREITTLRTQVKDAGTMRVTDILAQKYYNKGILNQESLDAITKENTTGTADAASALLRDALNNERTEIEDIEETFNAQAKNIIDTGNRFSDDSSVIDTNLAENEKLFKQFIDPRIRNLRKRDNSEYTLPEMIALQKIGYKEAVKLNGSPIVPTPTPLPDDSITEPSGERTTIQNPTYSTNSSARFAVEQSDFAMPPESKVELQFENGVKKVVTGQAAQDILKSNPNAKMTGQKSGMYLKMGVGTNPLLTERSGSRIPGLIAEDSTMDLGIVYQSPSSGQYKGFSLKKDTAFTTRNIKLKNNDLLIDGKTGEYARVTIIRPGKGTPLKKDKLSTPYSETERDRLEKTIFRVAGKDYKANELIKKYMIPMSVPQENKPEEVQPTKGAPRLIKMQPINTNNAQTEDNTYQNFLFNNINDSVSKKKALR
tara:strand:- start:7087 stop:8820 length:1734 start_codon:yes stop_codon:yes gene_type:complete